MFRTTYIDARLGLEIVDPIEIAKKYVAGRFAIDILSTLPFNAIFKSWTEDWPLAGTILSSLGLLKILRIFRLGEFIRNMNTGNDFKVSMKILYLFIIFLLLSHVTCCGWYTIVRIEQKWMLNMDMIW